MHAIVTNNLTKKFNGFTAVDSVSISIEEGEFFGLLGPNGAGKTTFISMLCTILKPTIGTAIVWGHHVQKEPDEVRKVIGIVFQDPSLDQNLTGRENLDFHGRLYSLRKPHIERRIKEVLELVELQDKADHLVKTYSGGMQRRLELARGLMHFPKILFLDEPTLGLDPQSRRRIWDYIEKINREEKITIILTTHYMEEADYLCRRVAIIDRGRIIALDSPSKLKSIVGEDVIAIESSNSARLLSILEKKEWVNGANLMNEIINLSVEEGEKLIPKVIEIARDAEIQVISVGLRKPTLEDVFIHYTGKKIREGEGDARDRIRSIMRAQGR